MENQKCDLNVPSTVFSEVDLPVVDTILQHVEKICSRLEKQSINDRSAKSVGRTSDGCAEASLESGFHSRSLSQFESLNSSLRDELRKLRESNFELQRKLDAKETELAEQVQNSEYLLAQVRQDAALWREKYAALWQDRQEDKADLETIRNYISTLPTREELTARKIEITKYRLDAEALRKELSEAKSVITASEHKIKELLRINEEIDALRVEDQVRVETLIAKLEEMEEKKINFPVSDLEQQYSKLHDELKAVKKVAAHREKRFKTYREENESRVKELESSLSRLVEDNTICRNLLNQKSKESDILSDRIKELERENQDSLNQSTKYRRQLSQFEADEDVRKEEVDISNVLAHKSRYCADALHAIVLVMENVAQGIEPDLQDLFLSSEFRYFNEEPTDCLKALLTSSQNIELVQKDVNCLRRLLNEQYGKWLGNHASNISCVQQ